MSISCSFCIHVNPEGSKFCNECGSPLRLKPCGACESVNDLDATHCHQCGAELSADSERAHELAESVRARDSTDSPNGADPLGASASPVFFDQYLDALRRDLGSRGRLADEVSTDTAQPPNNGGPNVAASVPAVETFAHQATTPATPIEMAKRAQRAGKLPPTNGRDEASAARLELETRTEPPPEPLATPEPHAARRPFTEALRPLRITPVVMPARRTMSPLLYVLGVSLLVIGVIGYGYYRYGLPAPAGRWLGDFAGSSSASSRASSLLTTASRSITRLGDGATPSSTASDSPAESASADAAKTANPASSESSVAPAPAVGAKSSTEGAPVSAADAQGNAEVKAPTAATGQPIPASATQSTSRTQASEVAVSLDAPVAASTPVASASPKTVASTGSKRSQPQRATAVRSAIAPTVTTPPETVDSNATTASPLAPICTKGVAALGLCAQNHQETN